MVPNGARPSLLKVLSNLFPVILAVLLACGVAGFFMYSVFVNSRLYGEAEPLVETVWPLAVDLQSFEAEHGRRPHDWAEVRAAFPDLPLDELMPYGPELHAEGPVVMSVTINRKYSFVITEEYRPLWMHEGRIE